jgi:hypothetical protein
MKMSGLILDQVLHSSIYEITRDLLESLSADGELH